MAVFGGGGISVKGILKSVAQVSAHSTCIWKKNFDPLKSGVYPTGFLSTFPPVTPNARTECSSCGLVHGLGSLFQKRFTTAFDDDIKKIGKIACAIGAYSGEAEEREITVRNSEVALRNAPLTLAPSERCTQGKITTKHLAQAVHGQSFKKSYKKLYG